MRPAAPFTVPVKSTFPSAPAVSVVIVTPAASTHGPVTVTVLPARLLVVMFPFSVTEALPSSATVLIPLAVTTPIGPTLTVLVVPPVDTRLTSSLLVPSIPPGMDIAPPPLATLMFDPLFSFTPAVTKLIASSVEMNDTAAPALSVIVYPGADV